MIEDLQKMTDDEWEKIARSRLAAAGYELILKTKINMNLFENEDVKDWTKSSTTESDDVYVGINPKNMTEAEFILKYA